MRRGSVGERVAHCKVWGLSTVRFAETTESIDLTFGFVDSGGPKEPQVQSYSQGGATLHNFDRIRPLAPIYPTTLDLP